MNKTSTACEKKQSCFSVFEDHDNTRKNMINFLAKVGSIQNLQNSSTTAHRANPEIGGSPQRNSRVLSAQMSPFYANQAMQVGAVRTGGPLHETPSAYNSRIRQTPERMRQPAAHSMTAIRSQVQSAKKISQNERPKTTY